MVILKKMGKDKFSKKHWLISNKYFGYEPERYLHNNPMKYQFTVHKRTESYIVTELDNLNILFRTDESKKLFSIEENKCKYVLADIKVILRRKSVSIAAKVEKLDENGVNMTM